MAMSNADASSVTRDLFLGGRVVLLQPRDGYRAAIDPVLLAAAVPAQMGDRVLDLGCGIGTAGLCLARRVPGCTVTGIDVQPALISLAERNAAANGLEGQVRFQLGDVLDGAAGDFHHVLANPPYLERSRASVSPNPIKAIANVEGAARLADWVAAAVAAVRAGGSVTFIHRADRAAELRGLMAMSLGRLCQLPLAPKAGTMPKRILLQGIKGGGATFHEMPPMILHQPDGTYTEAAERLLRDAAGLVLA
jgi:tRNA1(Val) A37 N6-methylase TrmN6